jgi:hypothetical protein
MPVKKEHKKIIERALKDFSFAEEGFRANRTNYEDDIKFVFKSDQWPAAIKQEREGDHRPCLTVNKLKKFVKNAAGDIRQNMPVVKFRPVDSVGDPLTAEIFEDIKRSINTTPEAQMAGKIAIENSLAGGYSFYRFVTKEEEEGFDQIIEKKRIPNSLTCYPDPSAKDYLYADGDFFFIAEKIRKDTFKRLYPKASDVEWAFEYSDWTGDDFNIVAEYYYKEPFDKIIVQTESGAIYELKDGLTKESIEAEAGEAVVKEKVVKSHKVMWCKMTAVEVIEGPIEVPGKYIPVVPVLGDEESLDGNRTFYSLIRESKDPQRLYNFWRTMAAELIALAPKSPYVGTEEQFEGHEQEWDTANRKNPSRLTYNNIPNVAKPQRERPPDLPAAAVNEANIATADIMDSMGKYQASMGQQSNERSGTAIIERKKEGDATTFSFTDNLHMSVIFEGMILLSMIPVVYDNERLLRMRGEDGKERVWEVNKVAIDPTTFDEVVINDLTVGRYDVIPDAGPGYATKRSEIANALLGILQFAPETAPAMVPRIAKVMDIPDSEGIAQEVEALMNPQAPPGGVGGGQPPPGGGQMDLPMS